jgi:hypothetical protein
MAAKKCLICNSPFSGRKDAKTCSARCRKRLQKVRWSFYAAPAKKQLAKTLLLFLVGGISALMGVVGTKPAPASAATSSYLNFQSRLLSNTGNVIPDGNYNIEFKIYKSLASGASVQGTCVGGGTDDCLWMETRTSGNKVRVVNGYMSVNLGSVTSFPAINWDQQLYLTMNIGGTGSPGWDGEMSPRITMTALPYAFRAAQLAKTDGSGNVGTLSFNTTANSPVIVLPDASGTVCLQSSSSCGFLTSTTGVQLQGSTPGTPQTGNLNISGTAIAGTSLLTPLVDQATAGALGIANSTATAVNIGNASSNITTTVTGLAVFKPSTGNDSATAFRIQNAAAADTLFTADTSNNRIIIGNATASAGTDTTLFVVDSGSTSNLPAGVNGGIVYDSTLNKFKIYENGAWKILCNTTDALCGGNSTTLQQTYTASTGGSTSEIITDATRGAVDIQDRSTSNGGTIGANLFNVRATAANDSTAGTLLFGIGNTGAATFQNSVNSTTAFQVQNAGGAQLLNIDTSTTPNLITSNPDFEGTSVSSWVGKLGTETVARTTTTSYQGNAALSVTEPASSAANSGVKYSVGLSAATTYTMSVYIKTQNASISTFEIGRAENGSSDSSCLTSQTVTQANWVRLTCTFSTGDTAPSSSYVYIRDTAGNVSKVWYIDGFQLEAKTNLLTNPGVESALSSDWTALTNTAVARSTTAGHFNSGVAGLDVTPSTTGTNRGVKNAATLNSYTTYTFTIYAKDPQNSQTMEFGRSEDGSTFTPCLSNQSVVSGSFTQYSCTFTTGATSGSTFIYVRDTASRTNAQPFYIDSAQVFSGTTQNISAFQNGTIALNGVINSAASFRNQTDSTTAFQIQSASGMSLFTADTVNSRIEIGGDIFSKGIKWTSRNGSASIDLKGVAYGNGIYVTVGQGTSRIMTSPDGINWTSRTSPAANNWVSVTYGNGLFVAVSDDGGTSHVMTSTDGITWTSRNSAADNTWESVTYGNGLFVAVADSGSANRVMTSPDGINWTTRSTSSFDNSWEGVTYGNGTFVAVALSGSGNRVMKSSDGLTWSTSSTTGFDNSWKAVTYGNGLFVAVANNGSNGGRVMTSPDGTTWTSRISAVDSNTWQAVTYGNGLFVAVGMSNGVGNRVMTSADGINWTTRTPANDYDWKAVTYGNGQFVAVGYSGSANGEIMTSGRTEASALSPNNTFQGGTTVYGSSLFKSDANSTSSFLVQNATGGNLLQIDTTNSNITLNGNNSGIVQTWQTGNNSGFAARSGYGSVIANGYIYIIGGVNSGTAQSTVQYAKINANGNVGNWSTTTALPAALSDAPATTANGYIYVTGGSTTNGNAGAVDTVYYAKINSDGTLGSSWNTGTSMFVNGSKKRWEHSSLVYNGYLYVIGGQDEAGSILGTVYYSKLNANGSNGPWSSTNALNTATYDHSTVVANGYAYVIAGAGSNPVQYAKLNADGTTGTWLTTTTLPGGRAGTGAAVVNGYVYVMGGNDGGATYYANTFFAPLNSDGTIGSWSCQGSGTDCGGATATNSTALAGTRAYIGSNATSANGYLYVIGGSSSGTTQSTVYYTSTSRIKVNGSLDLVGDSGENLSEGGSGGALTAGNTNVVGSLQVQGQASFGQGVSIRDSLSVGGTFALQTSTNSNTAFQIQNANNISLVNISTISTNQNLVTNPSLESNTNGWAKFTTAGTETTFQTVTTNPQSGTQSLQVTTTVAAGAGSDATTGQGAKYTYYFKPNTTYLFSVYTSLGSNGGTAYAIGAHVNAADVTCTGNGTGLTFTTTITRWTCGFTTGNTTTGSDYLFVKRGNTDTNIRTMYIDAAQLEVSTSASNSATNFADAPIPNLVANPDIENNTNNWSAKGSATISNSSEFGAFGSSSLKVVTGTSANNGASYAYPFSPSSRYTLSFWAKRSTSSATAFAAGRADNGSDSNCTLAPDVTSVGITTTWTQFNCTFTTGGTIGSSSNFYIKQSDTTTDTIYIDGVTLVASGTAQSYVRGGEILQADPLNSSIILNQSNSGEPQSWGITADLGTPRDNAGAVAYNGYVYDVGGDDGSSMLTSVAYSKINNDGTLGTWSTTGTSVPARGYSSVVQANGYIYIMGGSSVQSNTDVKSEVYYAKINSDGTVGTFNTTSALPAARKSGAGVTLNGYIYYIGGSSSSTVTPTSAANVYYAKLNADGTVGTWAAVSNGAGGLPAARHYIRAVTANGFIYAIAGANGSTSIAQNSIYYVRPASNGDITAAFTTEATNVFPSARYNGHVYTANNYVYYAAGGDGANFDNVYYSYLNSNGSLGTWTQQNTANDLPAARQTSSFTQANGYFYLIGGFNGTTQTTSYYVSTSRVRIAGALDLIGASGGTLAEAGAGGELTAGNTNIVGNLGVTGSTSLQGGLSVNSTLTVNGGALFQNAANSTTAFQVQNAAGTNLLAIDTSNSIITIAGNTTTFLTLNISEAHFKNTQTNKPTIGTPTNCATTPTATVTNGSTDNAGSFIITTGTGGGQTTCDTVITFNKTFGAAPKAIILTPTTAVGSATGLKDAQVSATSATTFTVKLTTAPSGAGEVNGFYYWIVE